MIPREVFAQTLLGFFAPILPYLQEDGVTEVMINGHAAVYIERRGRIERTPARFASEEALLSGLRNLAQFVGRPFDEAHPVLEGHLPDGSRVEAIIPPAAPDGPQVAIRRFSRETLTMEKLLAWGALTRPALQLLQSLVASKQNVIVSGGTNSGKTSLLNALSASFAPDERIVVIEDARELQLQQTHVVHLEAQPGDVNGRGRVTVRQLFRAALRMRPDRIVVGEVRGGEALDLVQAMTSGHGGCLSTVHASHPLDTLSRIETMALMSDVSLPLSALRPQVASAVNFIVQVGRLPDGFRCVTEIDEVVGYHPDAGYRIVPLFERRYERDAATDSTRSYLEPTGRAPRCTSHLRALGLALPPEMDVAPAAAGVP